MNKEFGLGLKDAENRFKTLNNIDTAKCFICGRKAYYQIVYHNEQPFINYTQVGYKGVNGITCMKCWKMNLYFNNVVFWIVKIIRKII